MIWQRSEKLQVSSADFLYVCHSGLYYIDRWLWSCSQLATQEANFGNSRSWKRCLPSNLRPASMVRQLARREQPRPQWLILRQDPASNHIARVRSGTSRSREKAFARRRKGKWCFSLVTIDKTRLYETLLTTHVSLLYPRTETNQAWSPHAQAWSSLQRL